MRGCWRDDHDGDGKRTAVAQPLGDTSCPARRSRPADARGRLRVRYHAPVGNAAGVNAALVHYHFGSMDGLFLELFRRSAEPGLRRLEQALASPQPLWALWDLGNSRAHDSLTTELVALARRHDALRDEIAIYTRRFRTRQIEVLTDVLAGYGLDPDEYPAVAISLVLASVPRYLQMESSVGADLGHAELVRVIERHLVALEGERRPEVAEPPAEG